MSGGHVKQGLVGVPGLPDQPDSLAWRAPSSGQVKYKAEAIISYVKQFLLKIYLILKKNLQCYY